MNEKKNNTILLVEDNLGHAELIKRSINANNKQYNIIHLDNGEDALEYIFKQGKFTQADSSPDLILLDLRLPKVDGIMVAKKIKESNDLRSIPIVILTTSENRNDILNSYQVYANSYLIKPLDFSKFKLIIKNITDYWLDLNSIP
ncbi:MAG: response regulator receiver protein [uncultured bacterium]|nr:MAG: response regulator receiver protein [uncultured bacterium]